MQSTYKPPTCCNRPAIANMDHVLGSAPDTCQMVNRICTRCGQHWYGEQSAVVEFTKAAWDKWIGASFASEAA